MLYSGDIPSAAASAETCLADALTFSDLLVGFALSRGLDAEAQVSGGCVEYLLLRSPICLRITPRLACANMRFPHSQPQSRVRGGIAIDNG